MTTDGFVLIVPSGLGALRPVVFDDLVRLGNAYDGGYVLPRAVMGGSDALVTCGLSLNGLSISSIENYSARSPSGF